MWDEGLSTLSSRPSKKPQGTSVKEIIIFYLLCCDGRLWLKLTIVKETMQHEVALLKVARRVSNKCENSHNAAADHPSCFRLEVFRNNRKGQCRT